jgi:5-formyltetrahydrofolate cyclo-ligase
MPKNERSELRKHALHLRSDIADERRVAYSKLIEDHFFSQFPELRGKHIHCYISYKSEVDTTGIIKRAISGGAEVSVPYLLSEQSATFENAAFTSFQDLEAGSFGILQPRQLITRPVSEISMVIVPLAAFDGFGHRLGYGKGYYDRFLSILSPHVKKIGLAFSIQEVDEIPAEPHDVPLDIVITEQGVITASKKLG